MYKIVGTFLLLSSVLFSLEWSKDVDTAFAQAKKEHKNVMVFVESETCRWCKKMKYRTFSDEAVEKRLEKYVAVKVMSEDAGATANLPKIQGAPTTFFMKDDKTLLQEVLGFFEPEDFIAYINDAENIKK